MRLAAFLRRFLSSLPDHVRAAMIMPTDRQALAAHIRDETRRLARGADAAGLQSLAYLLEVAATEAEEHTRTPGAP